MFNLIPVRKSSHWRCAAMGLVRPVPEDRPESLGTLTGMWAGLDWLKVVESSYKWIMTKTTICVSVEVQKKIVLCKTVF